MSMWPTRSPGAAPRSGPRWRSEPRWAEEGEADGSPCRALAAHLRALMARLEGGA